jgi:hypothetical protein
MDDAGDDEEDIGPFFAAWHALNPELIATRKLADLCGPAQALRDDVPLELLEVHSDKLPRALGAWLREHLGQWHGRHQLVCEFDPAEGGRHKLWRVRPRADRTSR